MKHLFKRGGILLCVLLFSISTISPFAIALSGNVGGITNAVAEPEHELSVMSFNILEWVNDATYAQPKVRGPLCVKTIQKYDPDLIGIQEAADASTNNGNFDWNDFLVTELGKLGYGCRYLTQESAHPGKMTISAGLMIFYKTDRFELKEHGSAQYKSDNKNGVYAAYEGFSRTDTSRYYHYVKLWDKVQQTYIYQYNTHLAVPTSSLKQNNKEATSAQRTMLAHITRTKQARQLADAMEKAATNYPCFATGDYNASWNTSVQGNTNTSQLYEITKNGIFSASVNDADSRISVSPNGIIDHVFYNRFHAHPLTYRGIYEEYGGIQASDHMAMMSYFNLTPPITFGSGSYDKTARTLTDSTDQTSYTFDIQNLHSSLKAVILNEEDQLVSGAVELEQVYNRFTIQLFNKTATGSDAIPYCTIQATIHCSAHQPVQITAPTAQSVYYANGGWHVTVSSEITSLTPLCNHGIFYGNAAATEQLPLPLQLTESTTVCYLRVSATNEVFPVYIHRQTEEAEGGKVLYVDDDIGSATGTVAFSTDDQVILVQGGQNAFGSLKDAAAVANTADGYTIRIAPGKYKSGAVKFTKNVTLLGNNADVSPLKRSDADWSLSTDRRSETVIDGQLEFSRSSPVFTIRGITFQSNATCEYAILQTASNVNQVAVTDIQKNIFLFSGTNTTNSSCIMFNSSIKNDGVIADNYFELVHERAETLARIITVRNPYGLIFEENYCVNFTDQVSFISSETYHTSPDAGNFVLTMQYNRFDNCASLDLYTRNTDSTSEVDLQLLYNDFVACGNCSTNYAVRIYLTAKDGVVTDYSKMNVNIFGNRFLGCRRALYIKRDSDEGDIKQATIRINQNRFVGMQQGRKDLVQLSFDVFNDSQINATSPNWDFSHNYFASDTVAGHQPESFVATAVTYNSQSVNSVDPTLFHPYYTNTELTWLSEGVVGTQSGITISGNTHYYDGTPHSLDINAGEGAVISYSLDPSADRVYTFEKPTLTETGTLTVYYQIERMGYTNFYGRALITVRLANRTMRMESVTLPYDGAAHKLVPEYEPLAGDEVVYTYNGVDFATSPTFVNAGVYEISVTITNPYARTISATATLTILAGEITGVGMQIDNEITFTGLETNDRIFYSVNGGVFTEQKPTLTGEELYLTVRISRAGCNDLTLTGIPTFTEHPFELMLTREIAEDGLKWHMSITPIREKFLTQNVTMLSYGLVTAPTAEAILIGNGTFTPIEENETGLLTLPEEFLLDADVNTPTAAYVTYCKDGKLYTVYTCIGVQ